MHLVGQLSNPSAALAAVFEAAAVVRQGPRELRESVVVEPASRRLGNGVVQRAVVKVLAAADEPMRLRDIHGAVGRMLGRPVSYASVEWCLRMDVQGKAPRFERVQPGSYRLASRVSL
jgi:hypothetical protein